MSLARYLASLLNSSGQVPDDKLIALAASKLTGQVPDANAPSGSVIQVVSASLTGEFSWGTKGSFIDITGLEATITPSSASSKILVQVMLTTGDGGNNYERNYRVLRNGSVFAQGPASSNCVQSQFGTPLGAIGGNSSAITIPMIYQDSPASTSAQTYKVQGWASPSSVTVSWINRPYVPTANNSFSGISTITLMEIAA